jgi:hypothetical protein
VVCFSTFHNAFKSQFNLSFSCPKSDTCNKCDTLNTKVKASPEGYEKKKGYNSAGIVHHQKATAAKKRRDKDTVETKCDDTKRF